MLKIVRVLLALFFLAFASLPAAMAEDDTQPKAADLVKDGQLIDLSSSRYQGLFKELRLRYNFSQEEIDRLFAGVSIKQRVLELMDTQWEAKPYYQYKIEKEIGVEREIVVAIWGVETRYGLHKGAFNLFQTLNTMFDAYPRRSNFYREQLVHFLLLCRENHVDPLTVTGSYGGAFGQTQFIPSSFRDYALDFDKDGNRDVWNSTSDVLASIANYLHRFGWVFHAPIYQEIGPVLQSKTLENAYNKGRKGFVPGSEVALAQGLTMPPAPKNKEVTIVGLELEDGGMRYVAGYPNFQAITAWNNSNRYAMAVVELSEKLAGK